MPFSTCCARVFGLVLGASVAVCAQAPATPAPAPAATDVSAPDISSQLKSAAQDLQQNKLPEAESVLNAAKAVNSTQLGLWALYGDLHYRKGDLAAAEADYGKELELHPDFLAPFRPLVSAEMESHQSDAAAATLRKWQAADGNNGLPTAMLVNLLLQQGNAAEAARAGEEEVAKLPALANDPEVLLYLGEAECRTGNRKQGVPMLEQALQAADLTLRNSAAYELADLGVDLPLAEAAQRDVIERIALVTEGWNVNENLPAARSATLALAAVWDTMGWIFFREGKLAQAEAYVRAAWWNSPRALIGEHLGDIQAARGNHAAALATYQIALTTLPSSSGGDPDAAKDAAELQSRIAAEQKAGTRSTAPGPQPLVKMWTLKLGTAGGLKGTASYRLLMQRGRIVGAAAAVPGGKTLPGGPAILAHADVTPFFPAESYSQVMHVGDLRCDGLRCELQLQQ